MMRPSVEFWEPASVSFRQIDLAVGQGEVSGFFNSFISALMKIKKLLMTFC